MPKIPLQCLEQIEKALEQYKREVEAVVLAQSTKATYIQHSDSFVRWLRDDFTPGSRR